MPRDLVLVTASLRLDGGGTALVARLVARVAQEVADAARVPFRLLDLEPPAPLPISTRPRHFGNSQARLAAAVLREQWRRPRPALVFNLLGPARAQALLPPARRSPYLLFLNGIEVWRPLSSGRRRALLGASTRLAISRYTAERAREFTPELGAVEVMPLALEERPPQGEVDAPLLARAGAGFVLTVGRLHAAERYKGHDQMLEAWPRIAREQPGARWVIAGAGDDRSRLEAAAARIGVADNVLFTGFASEATLAELYARCGLFALPSRGEGFGLVYLEAMRAGKPCLALAATAAAEIVVDGETGVLLQDAGPEPLAAAVLRLLRAPDCAARLGAAGARRYQQSFRFARFRDRLAPHLRQLIHWEPPADVRS